MQPCWKGEDDDNRGRKSSEGLQMVQCLLLLFSISRFLAFYDSLFCPFVSLLRILDAPVHGPHVTGWLF